MSPRTDLANWRNNANAPLPGNSFFGLPLLSGSRRPWVPGIWLGQYVNNLFLMALLRILGRICVGETLLDYFKLVCLSQASRLAIISTNRRPCSACFSLLLQKTMRPQAIRAELTLQGKTVGACMCRRSTNQSIPRQPSGAC